MSFEVLKKKYEALKKSWNGGKIDDVGKQLDGLKLALTEIAFLPTDEGEKVDAKVITSKSATKDIKFYILNLISLLFNIYIYIYICKKRLVTRHKIIRRRLC